MKKEWKDKKIVIFDLDDTLTETKTAMEEDMHDLLDGLLNHKHVAVISGGWFEQFKRQFVDSLKSEKEKLKKMHILPTSGSAYYRFDNDWACKHEDVLSEDEKKKILNAFDTVLGRDDIDLGNQKIHGEQLEDRGTQITFSGVGQYAPVEDKKIWDPSTEKRRKLANALLEIIPEFEITVAGKTSVDVTRKGINKASGIRLLEKHLNIPKEHMLFVGDKIFPGGNDYPVKEEGVECIEVENHHQTKDVIRWIISLHNE